MATAAEMFASLISIEIVADFADYSERADIAAPETS